MAKALIQLKGLEWFDFNTEQVFRTTEPEIVVIRQLYKSKTPDVSGALKELFCSVVMVFFWIGLLDT